MEVFHAEFAGIFAQNSAVKRQNGSTFLSHDQKFNLFVMILVFLKS